MMSEEDVPCNFNTVFATQNGRTQSFVGINTMPVIFNQELGDGSKVFKIGMEDLEAICGSVRAEGFGDPRLSQPVMPSELVELGTNTVPDLNTPAHDSFPEGSETALAYLSPPSVEIDPSQYDFSTLSPTSFLSQIIGDTNYVREASPVEESLNTSNLLAVEGSDFLSKDYVRPARDITFVAMKSTKAKNPPYLLKGDDITTKDETPVKFAVQGSGLEGLEVHVSLRFADPIKKTLPVLPCKEHQLEFSPHGVFTFYLTEDNQRRDEYKYQEVGVHPTAVVPLRDAHTYKDENTGFCVVFRCLNSCHHRQNKKIVLLLSAVDPNTKEVLKQKTFNIRVCKNVKRDHMDLVREDLKRKGDDESDVKFPVPMKFVKKEKMEVPVAVNQAFLPPTPTPAAPAPAPVLQVPPPPPSPQIILTPIPMKDYYVIGLEGDDRKLVLDILKRMGVEDVQKLSSVVETPAPVTCSTAFSQNF